MILYTADDCNTITIDKLKDIYKNYVSPSFEHILSSFSFGNEIIVKAEGAWLYTKSNRKILDITGGAGVLNLGHNHPRILKTRINFQNETRPEVHKFFFSPYLGCLSHNMAQLLPGDLNFSYFCNSGSEAVEGAIKLAYKFHKGQRSIILHSSISFHGNLLGANSISDKRGDKFRFPEIPGTDEFQHNSIESLHQKIEQYKKSDNDSDIYAIIIEPFSIHQFESVNSSFMTELREICDKYKIVLIFDEVFCGWCKTGKLFHFMKYDIVPDVLCTSKTLGGGKASISAYITKKSIQQGAYGTVNTALLHTTTYNGFGEECITAIEAINILIEENFEQKSFQIEGWIKEEFDKLILKHPQYINRLKISGATAGIFLNDNKSIIQKLLKVIPIDLLQDNMFIAKLIAASVCDHLFREFGVLCMFSRPLIFLQITPPLVITKEEVQYCFKSLEETLNVGTFNLALNFAKRQFSSFF